MQHAPFVDVKVDMRVEVLPAQIFMRAATKERLVCYQIGNACNFRHCIEEWLRVDEVVKRRIERTHRPDIFNNGLASNVSHLVRGLSRVEVWKIPEKRVANFWLKKVIDLDVAEGACFLESTADLNGVLDHLLVNHCGVMK